ncbi:MAG: response regulator [Yoonia sp.]|uniref:response regulator n=1 Tax=Yoonia sp. TaxID=2212373 RepID=UPI003EF84AAF
MPARILILDSSATNRIVLRVKMRTAQFKVDACADVAEARQAVARHRPDLVLISAAGECSDMLELCRDLRTNPATSAIGIIAIAVKDTAQARLAALDAGADAVMLHPLDDTLLLARIRSLLRIRSAGQELMLRESTSRALGFEEGRDAFATPAKITLIPTRPEKWKTLITNLSERPMHRITCLSPQAALQIHAPRDYPDLVIVDAADLDENPRGAFSLVADLRSRGGRGLPPSLC